MAAAPEYFDPPRRTALIVDDSRLACAVLGRLLEKQGFDIELAASGQEALDRLQEKRFDVIFMDHLMPDMMGLDAVRALKSDARTAAIPVVMFSSQEDEAFLTAAREAGALAVLTKHTERSNLASVLEQLGSPAAVRTGVVRSQPAADPPSWVGITRADLRAEFVPALKEQRDQIRAELLAEFAILENHQEGTRRALMGRLEALLEHRLTHLGDVLAARVAPPKRSWASLVARAGLAAAALALLAVPIGLTLEQRQRLDGLAAASQGLQASIETQWQLTEVMRRQVDGLARDVADASASLRGAVALTSRRLAATSPRGASDPAPAMTPLAEALAATGIEGPVELRSGQGAFCLEVDGAGYRLTPLSGADGGCLPFEQARLLASLAPVTMPSP